MKSLDFILPTKNAGSASEMEAPAFARSNAKSSEPFDQMMNRAMSKPSRESVDKHVEKNPAAKKPTSHPAAARKTKTDSKVESQPTRETKASHAESGSVETKDNSSNEDSDASTDKDSKDQAATNSNNGDNTAPQMLVPILPVNQPVTMAVAETGTTDAEAGDVAVIGSESGSSGLLETTREISSTPNATVQADSKTDSKTNPGTGKKVSSGKIDPAKKSESEDGGVAVTDLLDKAELVKETAANAGVLAQGKLHNHPMATTGTSAAQESATMKNNDQPAKVATAPEQNTSDETVVTSAAQVMARSKPAMKASAQVESSDASTSVASAASARQPAETSSGNLISASSQTEMRLRAVERTHDILALHGVQLKQTNNHSLHVVIKPGAGLQISLQMKQTTDGIEAQAVLQQGDFNDLNKHWNDLQQRLEERGIRLAPLGQDGSAAANSGNEHFQRQSRQSLDQDAANAGAFAEFTLVSSSASAPKASPVLAGARGWESWA